MEKQRLKKAKEFVNCSFKNANRIDTRKKQEAFLNIEFSLTNKTYK